MTETTEMIRCHICSRTFKDLESHIVNYHKKTMEEYAEIVKEKDNSPKKENCNICNEGFLNLGAHLKNKHNIDKEENDRLGEEANVVEVPGIAPAEISKRIFDVKEKDNTLKGFLDEFGMKEKDLRAIAHNFMLGSDLPVQVQIQHQMNKAEMEVERLKKQSVVRTPNLSVAELLVTVHDFTVREVRGKTEKRAKEWVLDKPK